MVPARPRTRRAEHGSGGEFLARRCSGPVGARAVAQEAQRPSATMRKRCTSKRGAAAAGIAIGNQSSGTSSSLPHARQTKCWCGSAIGVEAQLGAGRRDGGDRAEVAQQRERAVDGCAARHRELAAQRIRAAPRRSSGRPAARRRTIARRCGVREKPRCAQALSICWALRCMGPPRSPPARIIRAGCSTVQ